MGDRGLYIVRVKTSRQKAGDSMSSTGDEGWWEGEGAGEGTGGDATREATKGNGEGMVGWDREVGKREVGAKVVKKGSEHRVRKAILGPTFDIAGIRIHGPNAVRGQEEGGCRAGRSAGRR